MKKAAKIIPLIALLSLYSPKAKAESKVFILPLIWDNDRAVQAFNCWNFEHKKEYSYHASFHSISQAKSLISNLLRKIYDTDYIVNWGINIDFYSNIENYVELFKTVENDYNLACSSYEELQKNTPYFIQSVDNLEAKLNDPEFSKKTAEMENFLLTWNNQLPLDISYSGDKSDIEQAAKFINTAKELGKTGEKFRELSQFIDEQINSSDSEIRNLAYAAYNNKEEVKKNWGDMASSTSRIYSIVTDKGLEHPYSKVDYGIYFRIMIPF